MHRVKIGEGDWVVVCDGRKALVLKNIGDDVFPNLHTEQVHQHDDAKTHEQGTDAPGRSVNSVGSARSAMEQTDWHDEAERDFLRDLAARLDAAVEAGDVKNLIVVAPPRALGMIRACYSANLREAIRQEIDKDFVKMPLHEIERSLFGKIKAL